jgi:hypothetical protein
MPCFDHGAAFRHNRKKPVLQSKNPAQSGQDETVVNENPAAADLPFLPAAPPRGAGPAEAVLKLVNPARHAMPNRRRRLALTAPESVRELAAEQLACW